MKPKLYSTPSWEGYSLTDIRALLLDLDDTLLINDMSTFLSAYFKALAAKMAPLCPAVRLREALQQGTTAMMRNDGRGPTNEEAFFREFLSLIGRSRDDVMPLIDDFYANDFEALREYTRPDPDARRLVENARARGLQLAIATQPVFPRSAILARLRWAGVPHEEFNYDYISSYEGMRACKPHRAFFETILSALGRSPEECLMVGDSAEADMPAARLGLRTFLVTRDSATADMVSVDAQGSLGDLVHLMETGRLNGF